MKLKLIAMHYFFLHWYVQNRVNFLKVPSCSVQCECDKARCQSLLPESSGFVFYNLRMSDCSLVTNTDL